MRMRTKLIATVVVVAIGCRDAQGPSPLPGSLRANSSVASTGTFSWEQRFPVDSPKGRDSHSEPRSSLGRAHRVDLPVAPCRLGRKAGTWVPPSIALPRGEQGTLLPDSRSAGDSRTRETPISDSRAANCPSWARTRTLLIPCHFGFRRRSHPERSWSGLCLHLRHYTVRWLPPSLYAFPSWGLARRYQSRVRRLREHSRAPFPARCPASAPRGAARVRRVASYTKGQ